MRRNDDYGKGNVKKSIANTIKKLNCINFWYKYLFIMIYVIGAYPGLLNYLQRV